MKNKQTEKNILEEVDDKKLLDLITGKRKFSEINKKINIKEIKQITTPTVPKTEPSKSASNGEDNKTHNIGIKEKSTSSTNIIPIKNTAPTKLSINIGTNKGPLGANLWLKDSFLKK